MHLQDLKNKSPADLLKYAEELEIENASTLRKQDILFSVLKRLAKNEVAIYGNGVLEVLSDGFGFAIKLPSSKLIVWAVSLWVFNGFQVL